MCGSIPIAIREESFRNLNRLYLDGVRAGLISYNLSLKRRGGQPLFCMTDLAMTTEQTKTSCSRQPRIGERKAIC